MILNNGSIINGIFIYSSSLTYSYGDYVLFNKLIYFVSYTGSEGVSNKEPASYPQFFTEYSKMNSLSSLSEYIDNPLSNKLVPASLLKSILNTYIGGLNGNRELMSLSNGFSLDSILTTSKYIVKNDCNNLPLDLNLNSIWYVLNTYKGVTTTQELIDFDTPNIFFRSYNSGTSTWGSWSSIVPTTNLSLLSDSITTIQTNLNAVKAGYQEIIDNKDTYFQCNLIANLTTPATTYTYSGNTTSMAMFYIEVGNGTLKRIHNISNWTETQSGTGYTLGYNATTKVFTLTNSSGQTWNIYKIFTSNYL